MKRLIIDHFRRRGWIVAFFVVLEILIGVLYTADWGEGTSNPVTYIQVQMALMMGVMLLFYDLRQGLARTTASLPLTARQIGRAWWLATVGIPSLATAALLFLGAGVFHFFSPKADLHVASLAMTSFLTLLWMGSGFVVLFKTTSSLCGTWWERIGGAWMVVLFCGWFSLLLWPGKDSISIAIQCVVGSVLTVAGWFFAGPLVSGSRHFRLTGSQSKNPRGRHRASNGYGGIPRLISATFIRSFLIGLLMVAAPPLMEAMEGRVKSWHQISHSIAQTGDYFPFWIVIFLQLLPIHSQLRSLRTLPLSATKLAALMIAIAILPLIALGAVMAEIAVLASGPSAAVTLSNGFAYTLALAAICVSFGVWRGAGTLTYAFFIVVLVTYQAAADQFAGSFHSQGTSLLLTGAFVGISITLAFLFTRRSILQSSHTYRIQTNPSGNTLWGMGR